MGREIAMIGTVAPPEKYDSVINLTEYLTQYLGEKHDLTIYCSSKSYEK